MSDLYFYIISAGETYDFTGSATQSVASIDIGGLKRNYNVIPTTGSSGGIMKGSGKYGSRTIKITRNEFVDSGDDHIWNDRRDEIMKHFGRADYQDFKIYIEKADGSATYFINCKPAQMGGDKFTNLNLSDSRSMTFISDEAFFQKTTATTSGTTAITANTEESVVVNNTGTAETPVVLKITPTANATRIQVKTFEDFGLLFEGSFTANNQIIYDTETGEMTINAVQVKASQYISSGAPFNLESGNNTLYVTVDAAANFITEYTERLI
jgi:hypothetical protein